MKPVSCAFCGYCERFHYDDSDWDTDEDQCFCMKSYRLIENPDKGRDKECPLEARPKDDADKKGFYLIKDEDGPCGEML